MRYLLVILMCIGLVGCTTVAGLQRISSGRTGCAPDDIQISNIQSTFIPDTHTWTANCKGTIYYCSEDTSKYSNDTSCAEAK